MEEPLGEEIMTKKELAYDYLITYHNYSEEVCRDLCNYLTATQLEGFCYWLSSEYGCSHLPEEFKYDEDELSD